MTLGYAVLLLIAGHVAGDFYAQTNRVAKGKRGSVKLLVIHCALYSLCMLPFSVCVFSGESIALAWLVWPLPMRLSIVLKAWWRGVARIRLLSFASIRLFTWHVASLLR